MKAYIVSDHQLVIKIYFIHGEKKAIIYYLGNVQIFFFFHFYNKCLSFKINFTLTLINLRKHGLIMLSNRQAERKHQFSVS